MKWQAAKKQLLSDDTFREQYEKVDLAYEIGIMVSEARIARNLTQAKLAELVGTKQPSIARIEKGSTLPSLSFLDKIAAALGAKLLPPRFDMSSPTYAAHYDFRSLRQFISYNPMHNTQHITQRQQTTKPLSGGVYNAA